MPHGESGTKAALPGTLVRASQPRGPATRLAWPLAVLVIAVLSVLGWVAVIRGFEWATGR
jgi:hypothetical protein